MQDRPSRILLVRLREIGDVVFTTPAIRALRERFPQAHISYLVEPAAAPVVQGHPALDEVIVSPRQKGLLGFLKDIGFAGQLRRRRFDLAIDFHGGPRASLLTWLAGAPRRIGYAVAGRDWMYTDAVHRPRQLRARHSVENQWDLLKPLGIDPPVRERYPVEMAVTDDVRDAVRDRLAQAGATAADRLVVMHVSAGNPFRRWPLASFAKVAAALAGSERPTRVFITSGPSEADAARQVVRESEALAPAAHGRVTALDNCSLRELRALVEDAALYIGGDSGPMHIASTTTVPIVALYGPTLPARSAPWRSEVHQSVAVETTGLSCRPCDQRVCVTNDYRCLSGITADEVVAAAERLLKGG